MRSEYDQLIHLKLKQARRREIPIRLLGWWMGAIAVMVLCGFLQNCGAMQPEAPLTKQQQKANKDALWAGHSEATKKRLP